MLAVDVTQHQLRLEIFFGADKVTVSQQKFVSHIRHDHGNRLVKLGESEYSELLGFWA
jgi:hypothetical protein